MIQCPSCATKIEGFALPDQLHKLRDGEVVLYKRPESSRWQARFKLPDGAWHHISTKRAALDEAKRIAADAYDLARFRQRDGQAPISRRFRDVAKQTILDMEKAKEAGHSKSIHKDYKQALENYFIPYFGNQHIDRISDAEMMKFEAWRVDKMKKTPASSTLLNHNAALKRVFETAVANGWILHAKVPAMRAVGAKSERRPSFTYDEWRKISSTIWQWPRKTNLERSQQIRELLWDYVMILANTGMRTGTEAHNLKWKHISWALTPDGQPYLSVAVDGKTGKRELVARSKCETYFQRLQSRDVELAKMSFDELLKAKLDIYVFRMRNGERSKNLYKVFNDYLVEHDLLNDKHGDARSLYSLRHMYATTRLMIDKVPIHTLAVQMGTSVGMIEKHYSHLTAQMAADTLAGRRHDPEKAAAARQAREAEAPDDADKPAKKPRKATSQGVAG
jgi:integrase